MTSATHTDYMRRALSLAEKGRGHTRPNPMVGAVVVRDGRIIGEGYHHAPGKDHAEVVAIKAAGPEARGATLYVTLEPCCHRGKTGPCTEAIVAAGLSRVFYATRDPNPEVNGKGARRLIKAGLEVYGGLLARESRLLNDQFFGFFQNKRPWIIHKYAQTLDGRIATRTGDSQWISGPQALKYAHRLRSEVDAVVIGMGTVRADNPALTVRLVRGRNPYRIVVSSSLKFPRRCQLVDANSDHKTIIATTAGAAERLSRRRKLGKLIFWNLRETQRGSIDVNDLVARAHDFGIRSILLEGGPVLATSFMKAGLIDKQIVVAAPIIMGRGKDAIGDLGVRRLGDAVYFRRHRFFRLGQDMVFEGYPRRDD